MAASAKPTATALITGGTSGLGLACARALLGSSERQWTVLIIGRALSRGAEAENELNSLRTGSARFIAADLGSYGSIRKLAAELERRRVRLDALVCNAGVQLAAHSQQTSEGLEATFGINHLGHFLLVNSLVPLLNERARIVVVSSSTHDPAQRTGMPAPKWVDPRHLAKPKEDVRHEFEGSDPPAVVNRRRYTTSKLCNLYFTYELHRRIKQGESPAAASVTVNAFDPGLMPGTELGRDFVPAQRFVWRHVLPFARPLLKAAFGNVHTPSESGAALAALLDGGRFAGVSGKYFQGTEEVKSSPESYDQDRARRLWACSGELTELAPAAALAR